MTFEVKPLSKPRVRTPKISKADADARIKKLRRQLADTIEEMRLTAVASGSSVYLELPGSYNTVHVLTQEEYDDEYFPKDEYEVGEWISSSAFC